MGIQPVGISVDRVEAAAQMSARYRVPFPLLSDPDGAVHKRYRVLEELDEETLTRLRSVGIEPEKWSGRDHHRIAIAAIFLIDRGGTVRFAHAARDYRTRPDMRALLDALQAARGDGG